MKKIEIEVADELEKFFNRLSDGEKQKLVDNFCKSIKDKSYSSQVDKILGKREIVRPFTREEQKNGIKTKMAQWEIKNHEKKIHYVNFFLEELFEPLLMDYGEYKSLIEELYSDGYLLFADSTHIQRIEYPNLSKKESADVSL